jgi:SAM-dependent methyltransferase
MLRKENRISFRDPAGILIAHNGKLLRVVNTNGVSDLNVVLVSTAVQNFMATGSVVDTQVLDKDHFIYTCSINSIGKWIAEKNIGAILEHERIKFPSYPYEWSPSMLFAAGTLTLEIAKNLLPEGIGLKDATPLNILFRGPKPVFVDFLSFEYRDKCDSIWLPYAQFMRTFYLPLLVNKYFNIPLDQLFLTRRDGIEPEEVYRMCSPLRRIIRPFLSHVSIPFWLSLLHKKKEETIYRKKLLKDPDKAEFILSLFFKRLYRDLQKIEPNMAGNSKWSGYMDSHSYSNEHFQKKNDFVHSFLNNFSPKKVLDVGCNTGHFSVLAARTGASVTAIDSDPGVIDMLWRLASKEDLDILPLVVNLGYPSPAVGWLNQERSSFIERANDFFDGVIMLAVLHHLLVTDQIPLDDIIGLAACLTTDMLVIEFVAPEDEMFKRIARGRDHLYKMITKEKFEKSCCRFFDMVNTFHADGTFRWIYVMKKKKTSLHDKV